MTRHKRTAYDLAHVKSVTAVALTFDGKQAGKIVANWSDGGTVTTTVSVWDGPLKELPKSTTTASGYGYNKLDACLEEIFGKDCPDSGTRQIYKWLESMGYGVLEVC